MQVSTREQSTTMPLWNEILEVPVESLPCCGTLALEVTSATEQIFENTSFGATFGFILTDSLEFGFSDEWLNMHASMTSFSDDLSYDLNLFDLTSIFQPKLHISCSFDRNMVLARQKGMWPSHLVDPPRLDHAADIKVSELMPKSALIYRPRLRQSSRPGSFQASSTDQDPPRALSPETQGPDPQAHRRRISPERRLSEQMRSSSTPCTGAGRRRSVLLLGGRDDGLADRADAALPGKDVHTPRAARSPPQSCGD
jgi:hypothetical protein